MGQYQVIAAILVSLVTTVVWNATLLPNYYLRLRSETRGSCQGVTDQPSDRLWYLHNGPNLTSLNDIPSMKRVSSSPFISGDTFRTLADYVLDETNATRWTAEDIQPGSVIFVKPERLIEFFTKRHPFINNTYILISHNSDYSVPHDPRGGCQQDCSKFALDPQMGRWFGQNMVVQHPKMVQVPIGVSNYRWPSGDVKLLAAVAAHAPAWRERPNLLYININKKTHPTRAQLMQPLMNISGAVAISKRIPWKQYLHDMAATKFVVAPPGNGLDTHRAWEAVVVGAVPIILRGPLDALYEGMPVIMVDDYRNVTVEMLEIFESQHCRMKASTRQAWALYWQQLLMRTKRQIQTGQLL